MRIAVVLALLTTVSGGCRTAGATMTCGKIGGVTAKTRHFPRDVKSHSLDGAKAKARFTPPRHLDVSVGKVQLAGDTITLSAQVRNRSDRPFDLVVYPYGGSFPYGGDNPFRLAVSPTAAKIIKYSGKLYPPEPPSPMLIQLPAASCIQFDARIDLSNYTYQGSPKIKLDWAFHYFAGNHPKGTVEIQLPKR